MKKLLLILAAIAYAAIACEKPEPTSVDETATEDTSADTCTIYVTGLQGAIAMLYHTSSSDIDFDASFYSIQRHFTITLKDGSLDTAICTNAKGGDYFPSDSGGITSCRHLFIGNSLKYGNYTLVLWPLSSDNAVWGPNHTPYNLWCMYHNVTLNQQHTYEHIECDTLFSAPGLHLKHFTEF